MSKVKKTRVTKSEYKNIKLLQSAGLNRNKVATLTRRTHNTVDLIFKSNSMQDYKELGRKHWEKYNQQQKVNTPKKLASAETISEVIRQAKKTGGVVLTTHAAFVGFDDLYDFVKEASDHEVTVTFAPMGK
jgi:IS30 family transposase